MKLVNPVGRNVTTFATEVNRCTCYCANNWNAGFNQGNDYLCGCNCYWLNTNNENANLNVAVVAI
ncbi:CA_C0660 family putative sactipeptide bacteriocin [Clostridium pasteurianum]|nr:CA_C0660 family putative sactipeptide bacteriocin [Clostridium pasteurianum]UZW16221.1 CA_C0660 family putative sactipeptide bacteriocin [Clostridium pasteurianum]